jgi:hypothetical protein
MVDLKWVSSFTTMGKARLCTQRVNFQRRRPMNEEEIRVAQILSDCQQMLKSGGNNDEIRRQLTIAKHILFTQTLMQEKNNG